MSKDYRTERLKKRLRKAAPSFLGMHMIVTDELQTPISKVSSLLFENMPEDIRTKFLDEFEAEYLKDDSVILAHSLAWGAILDPKLGKTLPYWIEVATDHFLSSSNSSSSANWNTFTSLLYLPFPEVMPGLIDHLIKGMENAPKTNATRLRVLHQAIWSGNNPEQTHNDVFDRLTLLLPILSDQDSVDMCFMGPRRKDKRVPLWIDRLNKKFMKHIGILNCIKIIEEARAANQSPTLTRKENHDFTWAALALEKDFFARDANEYWSSCGIIDEGEEYAAKYGKRFTQLGKKQKPKKTLVEAKPDAPKRPRGRPRKNPAPGQTPD